ncbi:endonuclease/exonuclease/phosphatase family protein [Haloplanus halophilus]|uniref:endonuclease/exonuclease/phosphatase family protein n=1 Tax=Haloplanus halophilus TaxID=2949993 RepID=UPI002040AF6C|nr:endonuclease/exonuclease/phosphatase family protein [Haloplanus sp. GDY1]
MDDSVSRRHVLAGAAAALGTGVVGRARAQGTPVTVATRNCYLGADLFRLLAAATSGSEAVRDAVGDLLRSVDRSHPPARLDAVAGEIERTAPDLLGVQEAALIRTGEPSGGATPTATTVRYDFRDRLSAALAARDLPYRVVAETTTTDVQLPGTVDGERRAVRLTDRDLILAREDVATAGVTTGRFDAALTLSEGDRTLAVQRGYCVADADVAGDRLAFCTAHLEAASAETRTAQAAELETLLTDRGDPVALVGDLNSGPGGSRAAYDRLTGPFRDAAAGVGNTCCHAADLRNDAASLDARIDHVLVRGGLGATDATRVGADPDHRVAVDGDRLWPSDHAGVVATLAPGAAGTPTGTATGTPTPSPEPTGTGTATATDAPTAGDAPGFGATAALAALLGGALAARGDG